MLTNKILKKWTILHPVDMGSRQEAYLCENSYDEQRVLWWPKGFGKIREDFRAKIQRIAGLSCPYIAKVYDLVFDDEGTGKEIAIVEYCGNEPIFAASLGLTPAQKIHLLIQVLRGLGFMHNKGLLHLNIKSDNVYVDLLRLKAKIINWGIALPMSGGGMLKKKVVGTPYAMPYEVAFNKIETIDTRADLFSWAVMAYWVLSGKLPFPERLKANGDIKKLRKILNNEKPPAPIKTFIKNISPRVDDIICGMLNKEPKNRPFKNATEIIKELIRAYPQAGEKLAGTDDIIMSKLRRE